MNLTIFAQAGGIANTVADWGIGIILVVAVIGIVLAVISAAKVNVPPEIIRILWIILIAAVGILAIIFLLAVSKRMFGF